MPNDIEGNANERGGVGGRALRRKKQARKSPAQVAAKALAGSMAEATGAKPVEMIVPARNLMDEAFQEPRRLPDAVQRFMQAA